MMDLDRETYRTAVGKDAVVIPVMRRLAGSLCVESRDCVSATLSDRAVGILTRRCGTRGSAQANRGCNERLSLERFISYECSKSTCGSAKKSADRLDSEQLRANRTPAVSESPSSRLGVERQVVASCPGRAELWRRLACGHRSPASPAVRCRLTELNDAPISAIHAAASRRGGRR